MIELSVASTNAFRSAFDEIFTSLFEGDANLGDAFEGLVDDLQSMWGNLFSNMIARAADGTETIGEQFSAKDFRTWNATVVAAQFLAGHDGEATTKAAKKRAGNETVREVAKFLNNTPAVSRSSYIDPRVFDRFDAGDTIAPALKRLQRSSKRGRFVEREAIERAVVRLLR